MGSKLEKFDYVWGYVGEWDHVPKIRTRALNRRGGGALLYREIVVRSTVQKTE